VRCSGSRQLFINTEAAPQLPLTVFFLAVSQALSKFIRADCNKASLPGGTCSVPFLIRKGENSLKPCLRAASAFFYDRKDLLRSSPFELVEGNCDRFVIADEITLPYHVCGFSAIMSVVSLHRSLWYPLEYVFCR
jgi:hypothetical protein